MGPWAAFVGLLLFLGGVAMLFFLHLPEGAVLVALGIVAVASSAKKG